MNTEIIFYILIGVCITLFIVFLLKDMLFAHFMNSIISNAQVEVVDTSVSVDSMKAYADLISSIIGLLDELLSTDAVKRQEDKKVLTYSRDQMEYHLEKLNVKIEMISKVKSDGR